MKPIQILKFLCERMSNTRGYQELSQKEFSSSKIPSRYADNEQAMLIIKDTISDMAWEINQSQAGKRSTALVDNPENGKGMFLAVNTMVKSTFPPFLREAGFKTKKAFLSAVRSGKGKAWTRIALRAIQRLEHGTDPKNTHNQSGPDFEFMNLVVNPVPF